MVSVVNLTESKIIWEMGLWLYPKKIIFIILRWVELPTVGGTIPWSGSCTVQMEKVMEHHHAIYPSLLPDCRCDATSCFKLLSYLPYHDEVCTVKYDLK